MSTATITVIPKKITGGNEDLVMLPWSAFEKMQEQIRRIPEFKGYETVHYKDKQYKVPVYQLIGKAALRLDKRVKTALNEFKAGKTKSLNSLAELR